MVVTLGGLLLIVAFICFVLAALGVPRGQWIAVGLACWVLAEILGHSPLLIH